MSKISILLPVYNTAAFLQECLDSILAQSEQNWELLAIDNDSTDESYAILKKYAQKDPRIRVFQNKPNSIITALRKALQESRGQWITRMDADDRMAPQKLERMLKALKEKGRGYLAIGFVEYFSAGTLGEGYRSYAQWLNKLTKENRNFEDRYKECVVPSPCWMCHRDDLLACGAFDSDRYPEDYDLTFRFYKRGLKIIGVKEILHYWRDYQTRSSRTSEHYSDNRFLELKVDYFLALDHQKEKPLAIWGAGKKGKRMAQLLLQKNIPFHWLTDNAAKIGHLIYGQEVLHFLKINTLVTPQILISVAAPDGQREIVDFLEKGNYAPEDCFWFC